MSPPPLFTILLLLTLISFAIAAPLSLAPSIECQDSTSSRCILTFSIVTSSPITVRHLLYPDPKWLALVQDVLPPTLTSEKSYCQLSGGVSLNIYFIGGSKQAVCYIVKRPGVSPQTIVSNGLITLPALSYYPIPFEITPLTPSCLDNTSTDSCEASLTVPLSMGNFNIDTTAEITSIICPQQYLIAPTTVTSILPISYSDLPTTISVNRYTVSTAASATTPPDTAICSIHVDKTSTKLIPYLNIVQNGVIVHQSNAVSVTTSSVTTHNDCYDPTSSICTLEYIVPVKQSLSTFKTHVPFFYAAYDTKPVLDPTYTNPVNTDKRYTQRFFKEISAEPTATYLGKTRCPVYLFGTFTDTPLEITVTDIIYNTPLEVTYDPLCNNNAANLCKVFYKTKHIGHKLTLRLNRDQLTYVNDVVCGEGMIISKVDPKTVIIGSGSKVGAVIVKPTEPDGYITCQVTFSVPFQANAPANNKPFLVSESILEYMGVEKITTVRLPLHPMDMTQVNFSTLPFRLNLSPSCNIKTSTSCGYDLTLFGNHEAYAGKTAAEKEVIFSNIGISELSLPIYNLRRPAAGETIADIVSIFFTGSPLAVKPTVQMTEDTLGYDILTMDLSEITQGKTYHDFFPDDPTNPGQKLDLVVSVSYNLKTAPDIDVGRDGGVPLSLISFGHVRTIDEAILYTVKPGEIVYMNPLIFTMDSACGNNYVAFCPVDFTSLLHTEKFQNDPFYSGQVLHSILFVVEATTIMNYDLQRSTLDLFSIELISPRIVNNILQTTLTYNITFTPQFFTNGATGRVWWTKRLGADTLSSFQISKFVTQMQNDFVLNHVNHYYQSVQVIYHGDSRFFYHEDCADTTKQTCTTELRLYTDDIYPGTELIKFQSPLVKHFFYSVNIGCIGWSNISVESTIPLLILTYDYSTGFANIKIDNISNTLVSPTKPLKIDTTKYSYVTCTTVNYLRNTVFRFNRAVLPSVLMGVNFYDDIHSLYPLPHSSSIRITFPRIGYGVISLDSSDECRSMKTGVTRCVTQWTVNGSEDFPIKRARGEASYAECMAHPVLGNVINTAKSQFSHLCPSTETLSIPDVNITNLRQIIKSNSQFDTLGQTTPDYSVDDDLNVWISSNMYTVADDPTSQVFAVYSYIVSLCDTTGTTPVYVNTEISPQFQAKDNAVGYRVFTFQALSDSAFVSPRIDYPLIINWDSTTDFTIENMNPDRYSIPAMLLRQQFALSIPKRTVTTAQNITITYTFYDPDIDYIQINTVVGDFDEDEKHLKCYEPNDFLQMRPAVTLLTDSASGTSKFKMNNLSWITDTNNPSKSLECSFQISINSKYPLPSDASTDVIEHIVYRVGVDEPFFASWGYPRYTSTAAIIKITSQNRAEYDNSQNSAPFASYLLSLMVVIASIIIVYM